MGMELTETKVDQNAMAMGGTSMGDTSKLFATMSEQAVWTSIPLEQKALILKAMQNADYSMIDWFDSNPGKNISLSDVLIHNVNIPDEETGEMIPCVRTVLIDSEGMTYSSVSKGVLDSLHKLFSLYGMPPYAEPLKVYARRVKTRRYQTINLLPVV